MVLIDYPGFNLRLAAALKKAGTPAKVIDYISPQVWAWNRGRIPKMARILDLMICIFPFEKPLYEQSGLKTVFVGHPMLDSLAEKRIDGGRERELARAFPRKPGAGGEEDFPGHAGGSRASCARTRPGLRIEAAAASAAMRERMEEIGRAYPNVQCEVSVKTSHELMQRATAGMVASGTATLGGRLFRPSVRPALQGGVAHVRDRTPTGEGQMARDAEHPGRTARWCGNSCRKDAQSRRPLPRRWASCWTTRGRGPHSRRNLRSDHRKAGRTRRQRAGGGGDNLRDRALGLESLPIKPTPPPSIPGRRRVNRLYPIHEVLFGVGTVGDRMQDAACDLVRVAGGVWTPVLEVALVAVLHEAVRHADRGAAVGEAVVEFVDRLRLVKTGQAQVIVRAVNGDVLVLVLVKGRHKRLEVFLAAHLAHVLGREITVHARAVPVAQDRLAMQLDVDAVALAEAHQEVAGHPHLIGGLFRALAEDLEFPLALGHLGIDAFVIDPGVEAEVEVLVHQLPRDVAHRGITDAGVIFALRLRESIRREAERPAVLEEEVFLLEAKPGIRVVQDGCPRVGRVGVPSA